ncbi:MAG: DHH family phosphoesterase [Thermoguttaceae bacterium]
MIPWSRFVEIVRNHQRFLLTSHIRPDGDALGSELAVGRALKQLGKDVRICNAFATPPNLRFLDSRQELEQLAADATPEQFDDREVFIILDTTAWAQLGAMGNVVRQSKALKLVIDHHQGGDDLDAELFKNEEAEATGRLAVEAVEQLGVPLSAEIAVPAFVAVATDTGWFRFASATASTLRLAARLIEAGASPSVLYKQLYETDALARLQLIGRAFNHTQTELGGRLIYTWLEMADFTDVDARPSDSEDIINMTLAVGGTEMAVILVEQPHGGFKVSLRSRCEVDCSAVASQFGGGGHRRAAGAFLADPLDLAKKKILDAVRAAMTASAKP